MNKNLIKLNIVAWLTVGVVALIALISLFSHSSNFISHSFNFPFVWSFGSHDTGAFRAIVDENMSGEIRDINIDWIDNVSIICDDTVNEARIVAKSNLKDEDAGELVIRKLKNGELSVSLQERRFFGFISMGNLNDIALELYLPAKAYDSLHMDTVSGRADISGLDCIDVSIENVSGNVIIDGIRSDSVKIDTVSGDISVESQTVPTAFSSDSVSGAVTLSIPENEGFSLSTDTVSGNFSSDFALLDKGERKIYKNGGPEFEFSSVSGDISVLKK